ncbi:probable peptidylglycine alpha-hydroxylating monooxygenase 1 isoform X2 [Octopus vulgaris]|uniref:peptidylglycine monooxygenase n=1 Tax=Octopus vulgaris TaxID=6645 RepID=A0AA36FCC0_OCTVU|nr:probable peptidylglycine alpha-hydroxylating monooxygenase 1 isoform X2 [Octopus vulgaris]
MTSTPAVSLSLLVFCLAVTAISGNPRKVELLMPNVQPRVADTYLCLSLKANTTASYIVGFQPHANMATAHHILLYGCGTPGKDAKIWNCGEMGPTFSRHYATGPTCRTNPSILYAWAMDAPSLKLPKDVGFKVGGNSDVQYLVLQIHYKNVDKFLPPKNETDSSGLTLTVTDGPIRRRAGVYLLGTGGVIPRRSSVYLETACLYNERIVLHPFSYRTHTHSHGKVVSGYLIHNGKWHELGRKNPQKPQMFYNTTTSGLEIRRGDILAARCTMVNKESHDIFIGPTQNNEMCNFYVMYYVDGAHIPEDNYCMSPGPLRWSWRNFYFQRRFKMSNAPNTISVEPESGTYYAQEILQNEKESKAEDGEGVGEEVEKAKGEDEEMQNDEQMSEMSNLLHLLREEEEKEQEEEIKRRIQRYQKLMTK